jgi:hypothetical protein
MSKLVRLYAAQLHAGDSLLPAWHYTQGKKKYLTVVLAVDLLITRHQLSRSLDCGLNVFTITFVGGIFVFRVAYFELILGSLESV